ncbi:MAG: DUF4363 family protein [Ruminococcus sp.]|nr:DUF4363 family protein [Ruminococcus sp.]
MTRLKISIVIILLLSAVSIFSGHRINSRCSALMELSSSAEEYFRSGNIEKAAELTEKLQQDWEKFRKEASVLVRNNKLTELDRLFARVHHLTEEESDELPSELTELYHLLDMLKKGETPHFTSVF